MKVRFDPATSNRDITVPRPISRQKFYKGRLGQASTSSDSAYGSPTWLGCKIDEEEGEESEMVLGGPSSVSEAQSATSKFRGNGNNWLADGEDSDTDKEEDEEVSQEPVVHEIGPQLPGIFDNYHSDEHFPNAGILVKVISPSFDDDHPISSSPDQSSSSSSQDNQLLIELRVREYQGNFDGFAEINSFSSIDEMHEFIVNNMESQANGESTPKQEKYLEILLKERDEDRFRKLVETSRGTVRRVLIRNEHILQKLYETASLKNFPSPLKINSSDELEDEDESEEKMNESLAENMKRWYMIEMIGIWLKFITDVKTYREAIKRSVLKASCGIENDRYDGIVVPLKYK